MCFSNWLSMAKLARGRKAPSGETVKAMQFDSHMSAAQESVVFAEAFATRAEGEMTPAEVPDPVLGQLLFEAILNGSTPPEISEGEERRILEILALAETNGWSGSSAVKPAYYFWIWCGMKPYRWAVVPDQELWKEFSEESWISKYKGQCNHRTKNGKRRGIDLFAFDLLFARI
ncbi:hypothetical protein N7499_009586 [Penicillium canescens]|nr:hypothetical protein N7499_009586 [Penicillium canescens]KAJ6170252.1 hypothetical protein N7485_007598 [Penicillium canescens]